MQLMLQAKGPAEKTQSADFSPPTGVNVCDSIFNTSHHSAFAMCLSAPLAFKAAAP